MRQKRHKAPAPRKVRQDSSVFTWTLAAHVASAAQDHFNHGRGGVYHVDLFCDERPASKDYGALYVTSETIPAVWTKVSIHGTEDVSKPASVGYIMKLTGAHTREQWTAQVHAKLARLPVLTAANGWEG